MIKTIAVALASGGFSLLFRRFTCLISVFFLSGKPMEKKKKKDLYLLSTQHTRTGR